MNLYLLEILMETRSSGGTIVTTAEGREIESSLGISQLISEPTNFEPNKKPSCFDLVTTDQPNLDSGTRAILDSFYHHQKLL